MTDEISSPPGGPGGRRKRPPTVLDLEATDVTSETAAPKPDETAAAADAPPAPPPEVGAEPMEDGPQPASSEKSASAEEPSSPGPPAGWLPEGLSWTLVGAGIAGATGGILVFLLLWLGTAPSKVQETSADPGPQLAAIQSQLKVLAERPVPASVDPKALDVIAARIARLETAQSAPRAPPTDPALASRVGAIENAMKPLADNVAALLQRADGQDGAMRDANARIEKLTAAIAELQVALRASQAGSDRAARFAIAASALRDAIERGAPFAAELAMVKPLAPDAAEVAALEPFARSGVPGDAVFGRELVALIHPMLVKPAEPAVVSGSGGFLERLQANAERLVRVTPVGETRGDDRGAILLRTERYAAQGDVSAATAEINKLPADARAAFQAWIDKSQARAKTIDAGRRLAAAALAALKPAP
jgi:hypothetical protein